MTWRKKWSDDKSYVNSVTVPYFSFAFLEYTWNDVTSYNWQDPKQFKACVLLCGNKYLKVLSFIEKT